MKYEENLHFDFSNTMTVFLGEMEKQTTVLEFGPASGRLTRYLKEEYGCDVYIVEIDEASGAVAAKYARESLLGPEEGDAERLIWSGRFADVRFDYILFADVLEHLHDAERILTEAKKLLKDTGYILISLPNIAHNSVIIDLLRNRFTYRETGLLDSTHLRFWTQESIEQMLTRVGLRVDVKYATYTQVGLNEFDNSYGDCSSQEEFLLKTRMGAEIYQYVYKVADRAACRGLDRIEPYADYYYAQWFSEYGFGDLDTEHDSRKTLIFDEREKHFIFHIPVAAGVSRVRFDPINACCALRLADAQWLSEGKCTEPMRIETNAIYEDGEFYCFDSGDNQILFTVDEHPCDTLVIEIRYLSVNDSALSDGLRTVSEQMKELRDTIVNKENYICEQRETIHELNRILEEKDRELESLDEMILHRGRLIRDLSGTGSFVRKRGIRTLYRLASKFSKRRKNRGSGGRRVGVLNPYLPTLGGGEKHMGYLCQFMEDYYGRDVKIEIIVCNYNDIDVFAEDYVTIDQVNRQFGLHLQRTRIRKLNLQNPTIPPEVTEQREYLESVSADYDLFINFMFQSKHIGRAGVNIYECMFPSVPGHPLVRNTAAYLEREQQHDAAYRDSYDLYITNSEYTDYWQNERWGTADKQEIIYPPVFALHEIEGKYQEEKKKNIIISVGRFFVGSHSKKQLDLVRFFVNHPDVFAGYEYHLAGAVATYGADVEYLNEIKALAVSAGNVFIHENCEYEKLMDLYSQAKIFWHATGYGVDENAEPEKMEHFGITPVEAMSYGAVPVVINKGGPRETVEDGVNGFRWDTEEECVEKTGRLIADDELRRRMAAESAERAKNYSIEMFYERHRKVFEKLNV